MVLHNNNKIYTTFTRKLIYVIKVIDNSNAFKDYDGSLKIGDTTIENGELDYRPNSNDLRKAADKRIKEYMTTSGLHYELMWAELALTINHGSFRDFAVHNVLKRSGFKQNKKLNGNEWYLVDIDSVKKAILAVKENMLSIKNIPDSHYKSNIRLRPEQLDAIKKTQKAFKKGNKMLWNAKMRFGKTLTSLELIKKEKFQKVLIITHRPVVDQSWFDDFQKIGMPKYGYSYGSKRNGDSLENLYKNKNSFVYFASIQDLVGSKVFGGIIGDKNILLSNIAWDLIIVDEAHEGTQTEKTQKIMEILYKCTPKILELSGTPFNILDQYNESQVFTWNYIDEQEAKSNWSEEHVGEENPYYNLPRVNMFTFDMKSHFTSSNFIDYSNKFFNFNEFFKVNGEGEFFYKPYVSKFLDNITSADSNTNYPFSTRSFRNNLRHTLWILPGIKEANALENLLNKHTIFGNEYKIVNVVRSGDNEVAYQDDLDKVNNAITDKPYETKTITLTVRKLTTGVTIKPWTGVIFLSNTASTTQYLQAAFRAQTPYSDVNGMKTDCYIFDFAPDRALTIMAGTASLATDPGRLSTEKQEYKMSKLLEFLPIIGEDNHKMQKFNVNKLLTKLKRAYAEKAVRTGFDDDSIYSDELLKMQSNDLDIFNELQNIVGTSKSKVRKSKFIINEGGLNDDEYKKALKGKDKKPVERTPEEQLALKKMKEERKQKKKKISILRSVSIRIPLMIYGLNLSFDEDINIDTFVNNVDNASWNEFMPKGVDKTLFNKLQKYYDSQVFIEAGRIIREQVIGLDNKDPLDRTRKIADIFKHFKNPDKETVLTPWKVINIQLNKTIGGISFYNYDYTSSDRNDMTHWVNTKLTDKVFKKDTKFLEINSKTGLYPLYIATSLYWERFQNLNEKKAGKFSFKDEITLWEKILKNNIYIIAKTPMARDIAIRTLCGYNNFKINIFYIDNLVNILKNNVDYGIKILERNVNEKMKFDVIIGNPPYNAEVSNGDVKQSRPIYQYFVEFSKKLNPEFITLITPSKWFTGGKFLDDFRNSMLNDKHIRSINHWVYPQDVFPNTNIRGGVSYFLWDRDYNNNNNGIKFVSYEDNKVISDGYRPLKLKDIDIFIRSNIGFEIVEKKLYDYLSSNMSQYVSKRNPFGISTTFKNFSKNNIGLKCFLGKKKIKYIDYKDVNKNLDMINKWKVLVPKANNIGTELPDDNLNALIAKPGEISSETYLVIGYGLDLNELEANNLLKYTQTKFFKFLLYLRKIGQNTTFINFSFIPIQDFSESSIINWNDSIMSIDDQLFNIYDFSNKEIIYIKENINY